MRQVKVLARWGLLLSFVFINASCASLFLLALDTTGFDKIDVTAQEEYWGGFDPSLTYVLKRDAYIWKDDGTWKPKTNWVISYFGVTDDSSISPPSNDEYIKDISKWPDVIRVFPAGTKIKIHVIELLKHPDNTGIVEICAYIAEEHVKKKMLVYIEDLGYFKENDRNILLLYPREDVLGIDKIGE